MQFDILKSPPPPPNLKTWIRHCHDIKKYFIMSKMHNFKRFEHLPRCFYPASMQSLVHKRSYLHAHSSHTLIHMHSPSPAHSLALAIACTHSIPPPLSPLPPPPPLALALYIINYVLPKILYLNTSWYHNVSCITLLRRHIKQTHTQTRWLQ